MRLAVIGDTHMGTRHITDKLDAISDLGIQQAIVVGDFGFYPREHVGHVFLDHVNAKAEALGIMIYALPGNHEDHDSWEYVCKNWKDPKGFGTARSHIRLIPKVKTWIWDNKKFAVAGGAVSIDRDWRIELEREGKGKHWWANEVLSDVELGALAGRARGGYTADYLFTHDCSNWTTFAHKLVVDPESEKHRQKIDQVIRLIKPGMHFHGHMHHKYEWNNTLNTGQFGSEPVVNVATYGLGCNNGAASWGVLDTSDNTFEWRN